MIDERLRRELEVDESDEPHSSSLLDSNWLRAAPR